MPHRKLGPYPYPYLYSTFMIHPLCTPPPQKEMPGDVTYD